MTKKVEYYKISINEIAKGGRTTLPDGKPRLLSINSSVVSNKVITTGQFEAICYILKKPYKYENKPKYLFN